MKGKTLPSTGEKVGCSGCRPFPWWEAHTVRTCGAISSTVGGRPGRWHSQLRKLGWDSVVRVLPSGPRWQSQCQLPHSLTQAQAKAESREVSTGKHILCAFLFLFPETLKTPSPHVSGTRRIVTCTPHADPW